MMGEIVLFPKTGPIYFDGEYKQAIYESANFASTQSVQIIMTSRVSSRPITGSI